MLPNLIVIGGMKAGTTSLHYYLNLHPEIKMSNPKELIFFNEHVNWNKGLTWYESHFTGNAKIFGESSPSYTNYPRARGVPKRMHSIIPEAKLIYILRDPVQRLVSHYLHLWVRGKEKNTFAEAIWYHKRRDRYLDRSKQYMQLEQYLEYFPKSKILLISQEALKENRCETLRKVFRFLEVDENFNTNRFDKTLHNSAEKRQYNRIGKLVLGDTFRKKIAKLPERPRWIIETKVVRPFTRSIERPVIEEDLKRRLIDYFQEDVERLRAFTGEKFERWCL